MQWEIPWARSGGGSSSSRGVLQSGSRLQSQINLIPLAYVKGGRSLNPVFSVNKSTSQNQHHSRDPLACVHREAGGPKDLEHCTVFLHFELRACWSSVEGCCWGSVGEPCTATTHAALALWIYTWDINLQGHCANIFPRMNLNKMTVV